MQVDFRPAGPDDADSAVPLLYGASPAAFDFVFVDHQHKSAHAFLNFAFRERNGQFGYGIHTLAIKQGRVVGVAACFSPADQFHFALVAMRQLISFHGIVGGVSAMHRGWQVQQLFRLPKRRLIYIANLSVAASERGQGIGRRLIEHLLAEGIRKGISHAVLDVAVDNPAAQALYEHIGFRTTKEIASEIAGLPNHRRMEMRV